jgi:hypothetical protein
VAAPGDHQDDQEVTAEVTAPVTAPAAKTDRLAVTEPVTSGGSEVTAPVRRKAEKLAADQGGKVTIKQLQELGLSRRAATVLRRELVAS